jgi:hypothetical protein
MFIVGGFLPFHTPPLIAMSLPIIFFCGMLFLPHPPHHHLKNNDDEKALQSLRFYRNAKDGVRVEEVEKELEELKKAVQNVKKEELKIDDFRE